MHEIRNCDTLFYMQISINSIISCMKAKFSENIHKICFEYSSLEIIWFSYFQLGKSGIQQKIIIRGIHEKWVAVGKTEEQKIC